MRSTRVWVRANDYELGMELVLIQPTERGRAFATKIEFYQVDAEDKLPPDHEIAKLKMSVEHAQALMDQLYSLGIRPTEVGPDGALAATRKHLEDMRTLVFNPVPKP